MEKLFIGIDIGATTIKAAVYDSKGTLILSSYNRHMLEIRKRLYNMLSDIIGANKNAMFHLTFTGSGSIDVSEILSVGFTQEVIACRTAIQKIAPDTEIILEIGGEDSKIVYLDNITEFRMNSACAGGTGVFIDHMANLLNTDNIGLNELASKSTVKHTIAARCGVFAKTDIQSLLSEGALKEDIAAAVFQAVVNQTISALCCGRKAKGKVAFAGGPLMFLPELKKAFIKTLSLSDGDIIDINDVHLLMAKGAAISSKSTQPFTYNEMLAKLEKLICTVVSTESTLPPLFESHTKLLEFNKRHDIKATSYVHSTDKTCILGIDAGSTTTKLVLINMNGNIIYSLYRSNTGNNLNTTIDLLKTLYSEMPEDIIIVKSAVTGYGEALIKKTLGIDIGEVETIAHLKAAQHFIPDVESIIDIGGQDMKYINVKDGRIEKIILNEACSSGCGSFLETYAKSLNINMDEFSQLAFKSKQPADLGTRCTVFMNSKIKHAQKEGLSVQDILAGLSYSVAKNALHKVLKIRDSKELGKKIVLQGGVFYNDSVLRAFEKIIGKECFRPQMSGLMGAYGIALIALEQYNKDISNTSNMQNVSKIVSKRDLETIKISYSNRRCKKCVNRCLLEITKINSDREFISGNKCEGGLSNTYALESSESFKPFESSEFSKSQYHSNSNLPNLYRYKYERVLDYEPLPIESSKRGIIGIPRVLNIYENYPFWFAFFSSLGFRVELSDKSSRQLYEMGYTSMPSESVCIPAKYVHGHVVNLISKGIKTIFLPCIMYEIKEDKNSPNCFNCPIVTGYSEVIRNNLDKLACEDISFINPFLSIWKGNFIKSFLNVEDFKRYCFKKSEVENAYRAGKDAYLKFRRDIENKGKSLLAELKSKKLKGIVLAGRPYHIDPGINHGIDNFIISQGFAVLTEDSISHIKKVNRPLRVHDQWTYVSRMYSAASLVSDYDNLELIQLSSFGCGLDAISTEQMEEILAQAGKKHTVIKIDEFSNLGAIKIRIRSLIKSLDNHMPEAGLSQADLYNTDEINTNLINKSYKKVLFTKQMAKTYTIIAPQIDSAQADFLKAAFESEGIRIDILKNITTKTVETGLKYVNNDACYPAVLVIGQLIEALESNNYDNSRIAVSLSQSGCGCRDSNYIGLLRRGLEKAGYKNIPIVSLNFVGLEKVPGFKFTPSLMNRLVIGTIYSDLLLKLSLRVRPYEIKKGAIDELFRKWHKKCYSSVTNPSFKEFKLNISQMIKEFDSVSISSSQKPVVAIVGELFLKYNTSGNNNLVKYLEKEGAEVTLPTVVSFSEFMISNPIISNNLFEHAPFSSKINGILLRILGIYMSHMKKELAKYPKFHKTYEISYLSQKVRDIVSIGNQSGEGWYLPAKMIDFIEHDICNIICIQPFGCLSNQITGKGVLNKIKTLYPNSNLIAIDYDSSFSQTNQENRLKMFLEITKGQRASSNF